LDASCSTQNYDVHFSPWEFTAVDTITILEFHTATAPMTNAFGGRLLDEVKLNAVD
jgi:hypothetical protein